MPSCRRLRAAARARVPFAGSPSPGPRAPGCTRPERYRSGRNGGASKASCRVTGTWVRIPPSPPSSLAPLVRWRFGSSPGFDRLASLVALGANPGLSFDPLRKIGGSCGLQASRNSPSAHRSRHESHPLRHNKINSYGNEHFWRVIACQARKSAARKSAAWRSRFIVGTSSNARPKNSIPRTRASLDAGFWSGSLGSSGPTIRSSPTRPGARFRIRSLRACGVAIVVQQAVADPLLLQVAGDPTFRSTVTRPAQTRGRSVTFWRSEREESCRITLFGSTL